MVLAQINELNYVLSVIYRPPDTRLSEFSDLLKCLYDTLDSLPTPTPNIVLTGDLNFPRTAVQWVWCEEEGLLVPQVAGHREGETAGGKQDRLQTQRLVDLANRHCLGQQVNKVTHGVEILDLIWINNVSIISDVNTSDWPQFSDHKLVTASVTYKHCQNVILREEVHLCNTGKQFSSLNFKQANWEEVQRELEKCDWSQMEDLSKIDPDSVWNFFSSKLFEALSSCIPLKPPPKSRYRPKIDRKQ